MRSVILGRTMSKILVVDDLSDNRKLLSTDLLDQGYEVIEAESGVRALALTEEHRPDLILLDITMPEMDGIEVCRRLKANPELESIPIIMVSARDQEDSVVDGLDTGAQDYITKPYTYEILCARVRSAIRMKQALDQIQSMNTRLTELYKTAHQFVDNVSHEFRTPLTVMKEFAAILRDGLAGNLNPQQHEYLGIISNRVDDLTFMVSDMLDISKLEAGLLGVWRQPVRIDEIIQRIKTTLERKSMSNKVGLAFAIEPKLPEVFCDPEKIGRVIINLVVNAIKFSHEGGEVIIKVTPDDHLSQIIIAVMDNGPGIADENLEIIFKRFEQIDGNVRTSTKGFGLGLNIARELVHHNLGEITVSSKLGQGSTFQFTVPYASPIGVIERYYDYFLRRPNEINNVSLIRVCLNTKGDTIINEEAIEFLRHLLRHTELMFPIDTQSWMIISGTEQADPTALLERIQTAWQETNRNRPSSAFPEIKFDVIKTWPITRNRNELIQRYHLETQVTEVARV